MTAFEPDSLGNIVIGMPFHKFYFDNGKKILKFIDLSKNHELRSILSFEPYVNQ